MIHVGEYHDSSGGITGFIWEDTTIQVWGYHQCVRGCSVHQRFQYIKFWKMKKFVHEF